ncbi:hypothetical protein LCGC14_0749250 [marine sediment metagenome]|uniref:Uncharacterized protein n=1 Tax=marine sediment metagenome TaxID=412755 RepID=A0A0F9Q4I3_9ZZZZ
MAESRTLPAGSISAIGANFVAAVGKILAVFLPMAVNTKGDAVFYIKPKFRIFRKGFKMVSMDYTFSTASKAGKVITLKDSSSPLSQFITSTRTLSVQRLTILVGRCQCSYLMLKSTFAGAVFARAVEAKDYVTVKAGEILRLAVSFLHTSIIALFDRQYKHIIKRWEDFTGKEAVRIDAST